MRYRKGNENSKFLYYSHKIFVIMDNSINITIKQTNSCTLLVNINWHNNTLIILGHTYQPSQRNISYKYAKQIQTRSKQQITYY